MKLTKADQREFTPLGDTGIQMGRDIWSPESQTIGCGFYTYEKVYVEWEVTYDEYMYCVDGSLTMHGDEGAHVMMPGDGLFIPKGSKVIYDCPDKASVVVVIYPVNYSSAE